MLDVISLPLNGSAGETPSHTFELALDGTDDRLGLRLTDATPECLITPPKLLINVTARNAAGIKNHSHSCVPWLASLLTLRLSPQA